MLEEFTVIRDGNDKWYAESKVLVKALHERGWKCDAIQGIWAVAQPEEEEEGQAYSLLCAAVPEAYDVPEGVDLESFIYAPAAVGFHRMKVSYDLYAALWAMESA